MGAAGFAGVAMVIAILVLLNTHIGPRPKLFKGSRSGQVNAAAPRRVDAAPAPAAPNEAAPAAVPSLEGQTFALPEMPEEAPDANLPEEPMVATEPEPSPAATAPAAPSGSEDNEIVVDIPGVASPEASPEPEQGSELQMPPPPPQTSAAPGPSVPTSASGYWNTAPRDPNEPLNNSYGATVAVRNPESRDALVRTAGPTQRILIVSAGNRAQVGVAPGRYTIRYMFADGGQVYEANPFQVDAPAQVGATTQYHAREITLTRTAGGGSGARPVTGTL